MAIGILRRCRRCAEWRSIDSFKDHDGPARLCHECTLMNCARRQVGHSNRAYVLTTKARVLLAAEREAA